VKEAAGPGANREAARGAAARIPGVVALPLPANEPMKTVLVIDDHPQIRRLIQVNLAKLKLRVLTAEDGEEGLEMVRAERPDLILLDVIMPKKNGFEVLNALKSDAELKEIPVIMLTVKVQSEDISYGLRGGAEYYLPKPFHPNELCALVERVLQDD